MRMGIIRIDPQRLLILVYCLQGSACLEQGVAQVIVRRGIIRVDSQGLLEQVHCFRNLIGLIKEETQVVVRHPASWISYKRCPPKRFNVTVHRALSPSQHRQHHNNAERRAKDQFTASF